MIDADLPVLPHREQYRGAAPAYPVASSAQLLYHRCFATHEYRDARRVAKYWLPDFILIAADAMWPRISIEAGTPIRCRASPWRACLRESCRGAGLPRANVVSRYTKSFGFASDLGDRYASEGATRCDAHCGCLLIAGFWRFAPMPRPGTPSHSRSASAPPPAAAHRRSAGSLSHRARYTDEGQAVSATMSLRQAPTITAAISPTLARFSPALRI
jgi:hypothetical protein